MKFTKYLAILALALTLIGCGHGYEGAYEASTMGMKQKLVLGSDNYVEQMGARTECEDVIIRESDGEKYIICKVLGQEMPFKVIDKDTLSLSGFLKFHRIK